MEIEPDVNIKEIEFSNEVSNNIEMEKKRRKSFKSE